MKSVKIYTWQTCPYCMRAKSLLDERQIPYIEIALDGKSEELNQLRRRTGHHTVPQIFFGEQFIGGFDDLKLLDQKNELEKLLAK